MKWGSLINIFTLYKSYKEHNVEHWISYSTSVKFPSIECIGKWYAYKTWKNKGFTFFKSTDTKKQPDANIFDGNVQLYVLSDIPDNFQGVTENVFDYLPKPSRVNIVIKEN